MADLPLEPIYEGTNVGSSAQSERERNARNAQQKMNWHNKFQRLIEISIISGDKPWPLVDKKTVFFTLFEYRGGRKKDSELQKPTYNDWCIVHSWILENSRGCFHTTKKHYRRPSCFADHKPTPRRNGWTFLWKAQRTGKNRDFENKEWTLIRDMFITNLIDPEIRKELHKQTVEPRQALELAINFELRMRNQHQIQQHNKTLIPTSVNAIQYPPNSRSSNWSLSNNFNKQGNRPPLYCSNCGGN